MAGAANGAGQTDFLFRSEMFWAPARAAAGIMLRTQRNAIAMMQVNRKLADDLRDIVRREQDAICEVSQKMFACMTAGAPEESDSAEPLGRIYESAVESVREFNEVMAEAQSRSFAAIREHAQATADVGSHTVEDAADASRQAMERQAA